MGPETTTDCWRGPAAIYPTWPIGSGQWQHDSQWSCVLRDSEPRTAVLVKTSSNLPDHTKGSGLKSPRAIRQQNMVMSTVELWTKNYCAGEGPQQFTELGWTSEPVLSCTVSSRNLSRSSEQTQDFMGAVVVVIHSVCKSVRLLQSFAITSYKHSINPIIHPNSISSHERVALN
jgi:hypothetical protein